MLELDYGRSVIEYVKNRVKQENKTNRNSYTVNITRDFIVPKLRETIIHIGEYANLEIATLDDLVDEYRKISKEEFLKLLTGSVFTSSEVLYRIANIDDPKLRESLAKSYYNFVRRLALIPILEDEYIKKIREEPSVCNIAKYYDARSIDVEFHIDLALIPLNIPEKEKEALRNIFRKVRILHSILDDIKDTEEDKSLSIETPVQICRDKVLEYANSLIKDLLSFYFGVRRGDYSETSKKIIEKIKNHIEVEILPKYKKYNYNK